MIVLDPRLGGVLSLEGAVQDPYELKSVERKPRGPIEVRVSEQELDRVSVSE